LAERHARHHIQAWRVLQERRRFWTVDKNALKDFHRELTAAIQRASPPLEPEEPQGIVAALPTQTLPLKRGTQSLWARLNNWVRQTLRKVWNFLQGRKSEPPVRQLMPSTLIRPLRKPKPRVLGIAFVTLPRNRDLWLALYARHKDCLEDVDLLNEASVQMDDRIPDLEGSLSAISERKSALEFGVDLAQLRTDPTTDNLKNEVKNCGLRIDELGKSFAVQ
jgi:hypothetical protein